MAIPSIGTLGDLNQSFGQAMRQGDLAMASQQYLGESMVRSGQIIGSKIAETMAAREANSVAPFLQQSYMEAFDDIAGGNISLGLGKTIALGAQFGRNPILSRISNEAVQAAGLLTNAVYAQQRTDTMVGARPTPGQAGFDRELRKLDAEEAQLIAALNTNAPEATKDMWRKSIEQTRARRAQLVGEYGASQGDAAYTTGPSQSPTPQYAGATEGQMPSGSEPQDQVEGIKAAWPTMSEADRADSTKFLKDNWNITVTGTDANGLPIFADQNPQPTGDSTFDNTPPVGQGNAPQQPQQQAPATIDQAIFGSDQASSLSGLNDLSVVLKTGDRLKLESRTDKSDGSVTLGYKTEDGETGIDFTKEEFAPFREYEQFATEISTGLRERINSLGGMISLKNIETIKRADDQYAVRFEVEGKNGKPQMVEYYQRNEFGEPVETLISEEEKLALVGSEKAMSKIQSTLNRKDIQFQGGKKVMSPEELMADLPADLPYNISSTQYLEGLAANVEKMAPDTLNRFRTGAYSLLGDMLRDGRIDKTATPDKRREAFISEFNKKIKENRDKPIQSDGKTNLFAGFILDEKKPEPKAVQFDEDIQATLREGDSREVIKAAAKWVADTTTWAGKAITAYNVNTNADGRIADIRGNKKLSADQKRRAIEQIEAGRKKRLETLQ